MPLNDFVQPETTFKSQVYREIFHKLFPTILNRRQGFLVSGIVQIHDNARPHSTYYLNNLKNWMEDFIIYLIVLISRSVNTISSDISQLACVLMFLEKRGIENYFNAKLAKISNIEIIFTHLMKTYLHQRTIFSDQVPCTPDILLNTVV